MIISQSHHLQANVSWRVSSDAPIRFMLLIATAHVGYYVPLLKFADFLNAGVEVMDRPL